MADYSNPDVLVNTDWLEEHLDDRGVRVVEVDEDTTAYDKGHIRGAVKWNWSTDLHSEVGRDFQDQAGFSRLLSEAGWARAPPSCSTAGTTTGSPPMPTGC